MLPTETQNRTTSGSKLGSVEDRLRYEITPTLCLPQVLGKENKRLICSKSVWTFDLAIPPESVNHMNIREDVHQVGSFRV